MCIFSNLSAPFALNIYKLQVSSSQQETLILLAGITLAFTLVSDRIVKCSVWAEWSLFASSQMDSVQTATRISLSRSRDLNLYFLSLAGSKQ